MKVAEQPSNLTGGGQRRSWLFSRLMELSAVQSPVYSVVRTSCPSARRTQVRGMTKAMRYEEYGAELHSFDEICDGGNMAGTVMFPPSKSFGLVIKKSFLHKPGSREDQRDDREALSRT